MKPAIHLLELQNFPIFQQLQIEEALLRADTRNWCVLNTGTPPAIVLGISGQPSHLIHAPSYHLKPVPLIRRFSGGGTVLVNEDTLFATWICNTQAHQISCCPQKILAWTQDFYHPIFQHSSFRVRENDYVFAEHKFGGNAQYMCKERWLHHTSFLWDYDPQQMEVLLLPSKMPTYRAKRTHSDFLCRLKDHLPSKESFHSAFLQELKKHFTVIHEKNVEEILARPHRKATTYVDFKAAE